MDLTRQSAIPDQGWTQHYDVLQEMGDCFVTMGDFLQAQDCYERAAMLSPDEPGPYLGTGVIALQQGRTEDAEIAFRVALRLDGRSSRALAGLAMIAQQRQEYSPAFDLYLKSLELDGDNLTSLLGLFQVSCRMGSFSRVIEYLQMYLDQHPADTAVMFCLATLFQREKQYDKAKNLLRSILALEPGHTDARNLLEEAENGLTGTQSGKDMQ
jgi:cytochrome c-type biogenesis protein CcmH/NrfG